jgi:feruloyl esterase
VAAGEFKAPPHGLDFFPAFNLAGHVQQGTNPAFCRIAAALKPSADSEIRIEVWLPPSGWNGKFLGVGSFGWGGSIMYSGMLAGLGEGYAVANTDAGHQGGNGEFVLRHPEKLIDYAYRAVHEMTVDAKAIIEAFYGAAPSRSYWVGCSLGGLEGLIEAKRYPTDYDGIVAGAPPNPIVGFNALQLWPSWLIAQDPSRFIPESKYAMVHQAVVKACGSAIGQADDLVDEPERCSFDPRSLQCHGADAPDCLTAHQVYLLRQTYAGPVDPHTRKTIFPGPARGAELEMFPFAGGPPMSVALDLFRYAAFQDPGWDSRSMDWDKEVAAATKKLGPLMHVDSDLKPFFLRGGKLLLYIGWTDYHNPEQLIGYYRSLIERSGERSRDSVRLFTIPGMAHCAGGRGCDTFNKLGAIDDWVDRGKAPERIIASKISEVTFPRSSQTRAEKGPYGNRSMRRARRSAWARAAESAERSPCSTARRRMFATSTGMRWGAAS